MTAVEAGEKAGGHRTSIGSVTYVETEKDYFAKRQLTWFRHMPYIQWVDRTGRDRADWYGEVESIIHSAFSAK